MASCGRLGGPLSKEQIANVNFDDETSEVFMLGRSVNNLIERNVAQMQSFDTKLVSDKYAGEISFNNVMLKLECALVHVLSERVLCLGKGAMANADTKFLKHFFYFTDKELRNPTDWERMSVLARTPSPFSFKLHIFPGANFHTHRKKSRDGWTAKTPRRFTWMASRRALCPRSWRM